MLSWKASGSIILTTVLLQGCALTQSSNDGDSGTASYVSDSGESFVSTSTGDCLRTSAWNADAGAQCNSTEVAAAPVEAPVAAPVETPVPKPQVGGELTSFNGSALFDTNSAELTAAGKQQLDQLTNKLNSQMRVTGIEIIGHADSRGSERYNQALSERRADSVREYLQQSLENVSVTASGMGESAPIADNSTAEGRQKNRRVDVRIAAIQEG